MESSFCIKFHSACQMFFRLKIFDFTFFLAYSQGSDFGTGRRGMGGRMGGGRGFGDPLSLFYTFF